MKAGVLRAGAVWIVSTSLAASAVTVIDSFDSGSLFLSLGGVSGKALAIATPFGTSRSARLDTRRAPAGAVMAATFAPSGGGSLSFFADRTGSPEGVGLMRMNTSYSGGGIYRFSGFSALELEFADVIGSGFVIVEVGTGRDPGPMSHRLAVDAAGVLRVPLEQVNEDGFWSVESFHALHFTFESDSDVFSFTLNEIRAVPEPSAALFALVGVGALMRRRRAGNG
jgi:hypothetical protein